MPMIIGIIFLLETFTAVFLNIFAVFFVNLKK